MEKDIELVQSEINNLLNDLKL